MSLTIKLGTSYFYTISKCLIIGIILKKLKYLVLGSKLFAYHFWISCHEYLYDKISPAAMTWKGYLGKFNKYRLDFK